MAISKEIGNIHDVETVNEIISEEKILQFLDAMGIGKDLTESQKKQFIEVARAFNLNPFKREIHPVAYKDYKTGKMVLSIVTGYEVYIKRAERTGKLDGWETGVKKEDNELIGFVRIYRKDWTNPFYHEVYFSEVVGKRKDGTTTAFWLRSPRFQLKKVAISQAFRLCFPDEFNGMPYTTDELPDELAGRTDIKEYKKYVEEPKAVIIEENQGNGKVGLSTPRETIINKIAEEIKKLNPEEKEKAILRKRIGDSDLSELNTMLDELVKGNLPFVDDIPFDEIPVKDEKYYLS